MIDKDAIIAVLDMLKPEIFYDDRHRIVCEAVLSLFRKNQPIDVLTVCERLREMEQLENAGGPYYITTLTNRVASSSNIEHHIKVVVEKYIGRQIISISTQAVHDAYEDSSDVFELLQGVEKGIFDISTSKSKSARKLNFILSDNLKKIHSIRNNPELLVGVPSGLSNLDRLTGGWQNTDLIIIGARPSMGKSALVVTMGANAGIDFNIPVAIFSLEMSAEQLGNRIISLATETDQENLKRGIMTDMELSAIERKVKNIEDAPIYIDDTPALSIFELRAKARRLKMQHDIQLVIVDYLQLMTVTGKRGQNREGEVSEISRGLKAIAKELNIPVIALSQLSRKVEDRGGNKRPMLSDLRESGAIEQDADIVVFLHRPEYYGIEQDENGNSTQGLAELIIAKHRNGSLDTIKTSFISNQTKFIDYQEVGRNFKPVRNFYEKPSEDKVDAPF